VCLLVQGGAFCGSDDDSLGGRWVRNVSDQDRVDILCPTSVRSLEVPSAGLDGATQLAQLELENGSSLECELVVRSTWQLSLHYDIHDCLYACGLG